MTTFADSGGYELLKFKEVRKYSYFSMFMLLDDNNYLYFLRKGTEFDYCIACDFEYIIKFILHGFVMTEVA